MMNKKGQGISINTIIIIIIALLVLLVIAIIFLGGTGTLGDKIRQFFQGGVSAQSLPLATSQCDSYCDAAQNLPEDSKKSSAYCKASYDLDLDGDGTIDEARIRCGDDPININCPGVICVYDTPGQSCANNAGTCRIPTECGEGLDLGHKNCPSDYTCCGVGP